MKYSELRKQGRIDLAGASPISGPLAIYLETTNICNFKCQYCPESFSDYKDKAGGLFRMNLEAFKKIADEIKSFGTVKTLNFYMMGEPMVQQNLPDFIRYAKDNAIALRTCVTSNGSLLNQAMANRLLDSGLDFLRISIYGGNEESHRTKTASGVKLQTIKDNLQLMKSLRDERKGPLQLYIKMIDSGDPAENEDFLKSFAPLGDEVIIEPVMNWNDLDGANLTLRDREETLKTDFFRHRKNVCPMPFYTLVIHSDLRVSVCCVDWSKEAVVGDLKNSSLAEVWNGTPMHEFRLKHLEGRRSAISACRNCTYLYTLPDNIDSLSADQYKDRIKT